MFHRTVRFYTALAASAVLILAQGQASASTIVRIDFNLGLSVSPFTSVHIELFDDTPATRDNFLNYVNDGDYNGVIIHRSVPGFILQGGGFDTNLDPIPTDPPVVNEPIHSNLRGTVAMAKVGNDPDSATDQFFFNLADNSGNLDSQNGGFTAFARVLGNGMDLIDAFAGLTTINLGGAFTDLPVLVNPDTGAQTLIVMNTVSVAQLRIGDTDFDGDVDQDDADLLTTILVGGTDEPQYDVDANGTVDQADLNLLNTLILGDLDGNGFVDILDLNIVLTEWDTDGLADPRSDTDGNGIVDILDLNAVLTAWNAGSPPPPAIAVVPEPASLALLGLGGCVLGHRRSRRH